MEDFIYILLIFAWIGYSFYKVSKKKAEQAKPKSIQQSLDSTEKIPASPNSNELTQQAQRLIQQFLQSEPATKAFSYEEETEEEGKSQEEATTTPASSITTIEYRQDTFTSIEDTTAFSAHHTPEELKDSPVQIRFFENEPFDFKKAIVYQAILESPYIPRYY